MTDILNIDQTPTPARPTVRDWLRDPADALQGVPARHPRVFAVLLVVVAVGAVVLTAR
ncbi:MAG: hypothetical protein ACOH17_14300 [Cellulomonas sp.]